MITFESGLTLSTTTLGGGINTTESAGPVGQQAYTTPGTYTWVPPEGCFEVQVVAVGGGGGSGYYDGTSSGLSLGGAGGGLGWRNKISVTPGLSYTVIVGVPGYGLGTGGVPITTTPQQGLAGGDSYILNLKNYIVSATSSTGNTLTLNSTNFLIVGAPIQLSGTAFGNLTTGTFYIKTISGTTITISSTYNGATLTMTNSSGSMSLESTNVLGGGGQPGKQVLVNQTGATGGRYIGQGGGLGGDGGARAFSTLGGGGAGGGAGGYSGNGGYGGTGLSNGQSGSGGGGGGGGASAYNGGIDNALYAFGAAGGGVGILGQGSNGTGGTSSGYNRTGSLNPGTGGSGGATGSEGYSWYRQAGYEGAQWPLDANGVNTTGGNYGGGATGAGYYPNGYGVPTYAANGGGGALRIIWGNLSVIRLFPSTNTGDL